MRISFTVLFLSLVAACNSDDPLALTPLPPGVVYAWDSTAPPVTPEENRLLMARFHVANAEVLALRKATGAAFTASQAGGAADAAPTAVVSAPALVLAAAASESSSTTHGNAPRSRAPAAESPHTEPPQAPADSGATATPAPPEPTTPAPAGPPLIDLNTATLAELDSLPRVGPAMAQKIIDARPFRSVRDLRRVSGVGDVTFENLRNLVTVAAQ